MKTMDLTYKADGLAPCPFCDGTELLNWLSHDAAPNVWCVFCQSCDAEGPHSLIEKEAIALWNKRS